MYTRPPGTATPDDHADQRVEEGRGEADDQRDPGLPRHT
jgi:hypothetical protein